MAVTQSLRKPNSLASPAAARNAASRTTLQSGARWSGSVAANPVTMPIARAVGCKTQRDLLLATADVQPDLERLGQQRLQRCDAGLDLQWSRIAR
jgi:hypothetical protein